MYRIIAAIMAIPLLFAGVLAQPVAFEYFPLPETSFSRPHFRNGVGDIADFADPFGIKNNNPDDYPVINYYCPDTNFISHGFAYPTVPDEQVLVGNHLYVARGAYFVIYEIGANGYLTEIGRKGTWAQIKSIDHDGSYLYVGGWNGIEIYDGTDYIDPQLIGSNPLRPMEYVPIVKAYGDSLYYFWMMYDQGEMNLGIMDIRNRSNPQVVFETDSFPHGSYYQKPQKYGRYLFMAASDLYPRDRNFIIVFDLFHPSGVPTPIDSIFLLPYYQLYNNIKIYGNRLYVMYYGNLKTYEIINDYEPIYQGTLTSVIDLRDMDEAVINGIRYGFFASEQGIIYKVNLNDLAAPFICDSVVEPESTFDFQHINQIQNYSYAVDIRNSPYIIEIPGVNVYDWNQPSATRRIQLAPAHSYCERVAANGNAIYAGTDMGEIVVVDVTDKDNPRVMEDLTTIPSGYEPKVFDNRLFTLNYSTIYAFDLTEPVRPALIWTYTLPSGHLLVQMAMHDNLLIAHYCVGSYSDGGMMLIDMTNPLTPRILKDTLFDYQGRYFDMYYPYLFFYDNEHYRIRILDISNPERPGAVGVAYVQNMPITGTEIWGDYLYVNGRGIQIWNIHNIRNPSLVRWDQTIGGDFKIANGKMFLASPRTPGGYMGINVWDVGHSPINPLFVGYAGYTFSGWTMLDVDWPYVYVPGAWLGVPILEYTGPTGIDEEDSSVDFNGQSILAYPNPANSQISFRLNVDGSSSCELGIFDICGRLIKSYALESSETSPRQIIWDGLDMSGVRVSSGVYFARLKFGKEDKTIKFMMLK